MIESNPILVELTRGALVESRHRGALAIARPNGETVVALGEVGRPVFPRSAIKALQAVPLIESGAADRFGFGDAEIALACASHSGTPRHTALARSMLERAGLGAAALGCGAHDPVHEASARELHRVGRAASALHNNCSGKHAGMLATAVHLGEPTAGYWQHEHPVQRRVARVVAELTDRSLGADAMGIDGCSLPNWAIPLDVLAATFARYATGEGLPPARAATARRVMQACWAEPDLVAGPDRLDTDVLGRLGGKVFLKTGAEGVYCGALPALELGFAVKIDDGTKRASEAVVSALLDRVFPGVLGGGPAPIRNWRGIVVGEMRVTEEVEQATGSIARNVA